MSHSVLGRAARRLGLSRRPRRHEGGREEPAPFYDALYRAPGAYRVPYSESFYYFLWAVIADRLRRDRLARVLEVGCGPGQLAAFLLDQGASAYAGVDFSPAAVELARGNAPGGLFVVADARTTDLHERFDHDAVVCTETLEHIADDLAVVARFRPGRRCLCSVPNFPYDGHVRHFADAAEVVARYGPYFESLDVLTLRSPRSRDDQFFLFDGVRNTFGAMS